MHTCKICGWTGSPYTITAKEMFYGTRDEFEYFECDNCHCLQIAAVPPNLGKYYEQSYYSYRKIQPKAKSVSTSGDSTAYLDVGCGSGEFLCKLAQAGYTNLTGCDPFIEEDIIYENGVRIYKKEIHDMIGSYDGIFFNDSFEHVTDPHEVMDSIKRLLSPNGIAQIKIPVYPNIAFEMFQENWIQLDAPRHIFLHSKESMEYLASKHGLTIIKRQYDSQPGQIYHSYFYSLDIPLIQHNNQLLNKYFPAKILRELQESCDIANQNEYGDHAIFYLAHSKQ